MKGALIQNTLGLAIVIIVYYGSVLTIQYTLSIFDTIPILNTWRTAWDPVTQTFWWFFVYFVIPVCIIAAFIVHSKPTPDIVYMKGGFR